MGLRGPGAKPVKRSRNGSGTASEGSLDPSKPKRPAWMRSGLTRSGRVIAFVQSLKITAGTGAGKPFKLRPWQKEIIRKVYDPTTSDGRRLVRTALLSMGRKNGKTALVAALALCHLCGPEAEPRGQVCSAAADRNQAAIIFREMKAMVLADPLLAERIIIRDFNKEFEDTETGSTYAALSAEVGTKHGFSASFVAYDELAQAPDRRLFDVLETSTGARSAPLMWIISTQSSDPKHIMSELTDYAKDVNSGVIEDPTFVGTIFEAPEGARHLGRINVAAGESGAGRLPIHGRDAFLCREGEAVAGATSGVQKFVFEPKN